MKTFYLLKQLTEWISLQHQVIQLKFLWHLLRSSEPCQVGFASDRGQGQGEEMVLWPTCLFLARRKAGPHYWNLWLVQIPRNQKQEEHLHGKEQARGEYSTVVQTTAQTTAAALHLACTCGAGPVSRDSSGEVFQGPVECWPILTRWWEWEQRQESGYIYPMMYPKHCFMLTLQMVALESQKYWYRSLWCAGQESISSLTNVRRTVTQFLAAVVRMSGLSKVSTMKWLSLTPGIVLQICKDVA